MHPALRPYVRSLSVYDTRRPSPGIHVGLPSTAITLVLSDLEPLDVGWAGRSQTRLRLWGNVSGLSTAPAEIRHTGRMRGVQLGLTPAGARALLGVPAAALAGELADLDDVDPAWRRLPERLAVVPPADRARWIQRRLLELLARRGVPAARAEVARSLAALARGEPVARVADEAGFSRRHLGDLVRAETGVAPKQFGRLARFERAVRLVRDGVPLAAVAPRAGYADQPHLTREWTALAGCSPTAWRRRELPFVQDEATAHAEG